MSLSSSLDTTDRLEMGRYDLRSVGSMLDFLTIGVMYAAFMLDGMTPCSRDQVNNWQRKDANRSTLVFSSHVGSGSVRHCLSGRDCTALITSIVMTGVNRRCSQPTGAAGKRRLSSTSSGGPNASNLVVKELVMDRHVHDGWRRTSTSHQLIQWLPQAMRMLLISRSTSFPEISSLMTQWAKVLPTLESPSLHYQWVEVWDGSSAPSSSFSWTQLSLGMPTLVIKPSNYNYNKKQLLLLLLLLLLPPLLVVVVVEYLLYY